MVAGLLLLAVCSTVAVVALVTLWPFRVARIYTSNLYGKIVGRGITYLAGVTPNVRNFEGLEGQKRAIYVANHTSSLDAFLCVWMCPYGGCGVFKKEIVRVPFFGWIAALSGHLLIDRSNTGRAVESLRKTGELMKRHKLGAWIMPEGTRSKDGRLLPFKKGFVHLAIATGLPIVPVVIHGANRNWEKGTFRFVPITLDVDILPAIDTTGWNEDRAAEHVEQIRALFVAALPEERQLLAAA